MLGAYVAALQDAPEHAPDNPGPGVSPNANAALRRSLLYHAGLVFPDVNKAVPGRHRATSHCSPPVAFRGRFPDRNGKWREVEACIEHAGDLTDWHPTGT